MASRAEQTAQGSIQEEFEEENEVERDNKEDQDVDRNDEEDINSLFEPFWQPYDPLDGIPPN